jgi:hypothetical protein
MAAYHYTFATVKYVYTFCQTYFELSLICFVFIGLLAGLWEFPSFDTESDSHPASSNVLKLLEEQHGVKVSAAKLFKQLGQVRIYIPLCVLCVFECMSAAVRACTCMCVLFKINTNSYISMTVDISNTNGKHFEHQYNTKIKL